MEVTIIKETPRELLHRKDFVVRVFHEKATPSRANVSQALLPKLNAKKELLIIKKILPVFGQSASMVHAAVYQSKDALELYEATHIRKRNKSEEKPVEDKPAEPAEGA